MSVNVSEIGRVIGCLFPLEYACDWDNSGFQVDMGNETDKILICLDVTPEIIREAAGMGCGMIVSPPSAAVSAAKVCKNRWVCGRVHSGAYKERNIFIQRAYERR
jgi:putative NIF3 family GTP cyclohydrolase 1 type 2